MEYVVRPRLSYCVTTTELIFLLTMFWGPAFALGALVEWRILVGRRDLVAWLVGAFIVEILLAFAIWLSPLHMYFFELEFLGSFSVGSLPLQAGLLASSVVTFLLWAGHRHGKEPAP